MDEKCIWKEFTNQYGLSKTLRFELVPVGKTQENIKNSGLIEKDEKRAEEYKIMKKIIDEYHKYFIDSVLKNVGINKNDLEKLFNLYNEIKNLKKNKNKEKKFENSQKKFLVEKKTIKTNLRKKVEEFKLNENFKFKDLFGKKLIQKILPTWFDENFKIFENKNKKELKKLIEEFKNWTTYFNGFNENRKNIYKVDIATSIIYRIVEDNMIKFFNNINNYNKLKEDYQNDFFEDKIYKELNEELKNKKLNEIFKIENFNNCLNQKGIDNFNTILGGKKLENENEKRKGLNEYINLFSQRKNDRKIRYLKMTELFKQILSDSETSSFVYKKIENDKNLIKNLNSIYNNLNDKNKDKENLNIFERIKNLFEDIKEKNLKEIYIKNDLQLTTISQFLFSDYDFINRSLENYYEIENPFKNKDKPLKKESEKIEKLLKKKHISLYEIKESIELYEKEIDEKKFINLFDYLKNFKIKNNKKKEIEIFENIKSEYKNIEKLLKENFNDDDKNLINKKEEIKKIKLFLDSLMDLFHFVKPLSVFVKAKDNKDNYEKDEFFYGEFDEIFNEIKKINSLYDQVRNYLTQKSYSVEKFKLNFKNSTLGSGWDKNKESNNTSIIFKKDNLFYLGIMNKKNNKIFEDKNIKFSNEKYYEKMNYKQVSGASKMLPKIFFSNKWLEKNPIEKLFKENYDKKLHTKGKENKEDFDPSFFCHKLINYFKKSLETYEVKNEKWKEIYNLTFVRNKKL